MLCLFIWMSSVWGFFFYLWMMALNCSLLASAKLHRQLCIHTAKEQVSTCTHTKEIPQNKNAHTRKMAVPQHRHLFIPLSPSFPHKNLPLHTPLSPLPFLPPSALIRFSQHRFNLQFHSHILSSGLLALMSNSFSLISLALCFSSSFSSLSSSLWLSAPRSSSLLIRDN